MSRRFPEDREVDEADSHGCRHGERGAKRRTENCADMAGLTPTSLCQSRCQRLDCPLMASCSEPVAEYVWRARSVSAARRSAA